MYIHTNEVCYCTVHTHRLHLANIHTKSTPSEHTPMYTHTLLPQPQLNGLCISHIPKTFIFGACTLHYCWSDRLNVSHPYIYINVDAICSYVCISLAFWFSTFLLSTYYFIKFIPLQSLALLTLL